ncbi:MAG: thiamine diphosphokinase [Sulfitobacter sp.]
MPQSTLYTPIVQSTDPVTLIGGGDATPQDLHKALRLAPTCVAADGGAALAVAEQVPLAAVIGDFDSVSADVLSAVPVAAHHRIQEQDSTDFEKALVRIAAPVVVGVGFLGGRVDHQLAAFHSLMRYPDRPCVLLGAHEVICLAPPHIQIDTVAGDDVSLFPLGGVTGRSSGLVWPIDGLEFSPGKQSGTSNRAEGPITLHMSAPAMLLILPRRFMPALVEQFLRSDVARWPALSK